MKLHGYCLMASIFLTVALIFTGQALAGDIDAKLPDSDDTSSFQVKNSADNVLMKVQSGGNVGIGGTKSEATLYIGDVKDLGLMIEDAQANTSMRISNTSAAGSSFDIGVGGTGSLQPGLFYIHGFETWLVINYDNGKVGIGTKSPQYKMDVIGDIRATGSVYYGGTSGNADGAAYTKPDYVFQEGYKKMSTEDVAGYLEKEGHLPWLTSLKREKEENGEMVNMTRMAFETVETVENLQLQIVELSKLVSAQQKQIKQLLNDTR